MSENEEDRDNYTKEKQQYLRTNIITPGYDPAHFTDFMGDQRDDGEDIDNWSFGSLKEMVQKYIRLTGSPSSNIDSDEEESPVKTSQYKNQSENEESEEEEDPFNSKPAPVQKKPVQIDSDSESKQEDQEDTSTKTNMEKSNYFEDVSTIPSRGRSNVEMYVADISEGEGEEEPEDNTNQDENKDLKAIEDSGFVNIPPLGVPSKPQDSATSKLPIVTGSKDQSQESTKEDDIVNKLLEDYKQKKFEVNDFKGKVKTREIRMPTELTNARNLNCKVSDPQLVKGGVFSKSYVTYSIKTNPFDYKVCRRYSDFLWLRNILVREYPSYSVPPMCKKSGVSNTDMEGIHKRMQYLQFFLDSILSHTELRSSIHLQSFLKISNMDQFSKVRDGLEAKMTQISGIRDNFAKMVGFNSKLLVNQFANLEGEVQCRVSPQIREFSIALEEMQKQLLPANIKLKDCLKELNMLYCQITNCYARLSNVSSDISKIHDDYNKKVQFCRATNNQKVYSTMSSGFKTMAEFYRIQSLTVKNSLLKNIKWNKYEYNAHLELVKIRNNIGTIYYKSHLDLDSKKDKLFAQGHNSTWEVDFKNIPKADQASVIQNKKLVKHMMLPSLSKEVEDMRAIFGYFNIQLVKETQYMFRSSTIRLAKAITEFGNDNTEINDKKVQLYKNLNAKIWELYGNAQKEEEQVLRGDLDIVKDIQIV